MSRGDYVGKLINQHLTGSALSFATQRSDLTSDHIYFENLRALSEMCMTRFEWLNLPMTISSRYIEKKLFYNGCVVFFKDDPTKSNALLALEGSGVGMVNQNEEYIKYKITAPSYRSIRNLSSSEAAPVYSNPSRVPDVMLATLFANRLTTLDVTFDVNAVNVRRTRVLVADENESMTMNAVHDSINRGDPVIKLRRPLDTKQVDTIDLGVSASSLADIHIARQRLWADAMTRLGIDNANQDKKERMVADEVGANDAQIGAMRQVALNERKEACKLINRRFNTNIDVRYREMTTDIGSGDMTTESEDV